MSVTVPSTAVQTGGLVRLGICPRHGSPAVRTKKRSYYTPTPLWVLVLILASLLIAVIVLLAIRKTVSGPVPDCATCVAEQKKRTITAWSLLAGSLLVLVGGIAANSGGVEVLAFLGLLVALFYPFLAPKKWQQAVVSKDGYWVELKDPSPTFVAAVQRAMAAAAAPPTTPLV